jgi:hypothetical protein
MGTQTKQPIMPWRSGGPGDAELGGSLESTCLTRAIVAMLRGGTVVIPHFPFPTESPCLVRGEFRVGPELIRQRDDGFGGHWIAGVMWCADGLQ